MARWSKLTVTAVGLLAAGSLTTGLAAAATTATTRPVTLCVDKASRVVAAPTANRHCNKRRQTTIHVASGSDVSALASRLHVDEVTQSHDRSAIRAQASAIAAMQRKLVVLSRVGALVVTRVAVSPNCAGDQPPIGTVCTMTLRIEGVVRPSSTVWLEDGVSLDPIAQWVVGVDGVLATTWTTKPFTCTGNLNFAWQARGLSAALTDLMSNVYAAGC